MWDVLKDKLSPYIDPIKRILEIEGIEEFGQSALDVLANIPGLFGRGGHVPEIQGSNWSGQDRKNLLGFGENVFGEIRKGGDYGIRDNLQPKKVQAPNGNTRENYIPRTRTSSSFWKNTRDVEGVDANTSTIRKIQGANHTILDRDITNLSQLGYGGHNRNSRGNYPDHKQRGGRVGEGSRAGEGKVTKERYQVMFDVVKDISLGLL